MQKITNEFEYNEAQKKVEELLVKINGDFSFDNPEFVMFDRLTDLIAQYEDEHYEIEKPSLIEVIKLRMYELGLNQTQLAEVLGTKKTRVSEYLNGKRDITLEIARELHKKLNIDGDIILQ